MGKSTRWKTAVTPQGVKQEVRGKVHVNDPTRRPAAKHNSVKKSTKARAGNNAAGLNAGLPVRPAGPGKGSVHAKPLSKPTKIPTQKIQTQDVDQFGNKLSPDNDAFFDGGAENGVV
jgi:hypothetical protein